MIVIKKKTTNKKVFKSFFGIACRTFAELFLVSARVIYMYINIRYTRVHLRDGPREQSAGSPPRSSRWQRCADHGWDVPVFSGRREFYSFAFVIIKYRYFVYRLAQPEIFQRAQGSPYTRSNKENSIKK